jgi:hypothetical protein
MMNLSLYEIFSIIFIHWIADFIFQTHWQATNKSKDDLALLSHTSTYSLCWVIPIFILFTKFGHNGDVYYRFNISFFFCVITLVLHTITDYFTSRLNSKLWAKGDVHNFFVSVGFDQCLHYVQLFLTYYLLKTI